MSNLNNLEPILYKIATEILNETPEKITNGLIVLKDWISQQSHLNAKIDDKFLIAFLRYRKYDLVAAQQQIETYYKFRLIAPELYVDRDPIEPTLNRMINSGIFFRLPNFHPDDGTKIVIFSAKILLETNTNAQDLIKCGAMCCDLIIDDPFVNVAGVQLIYDLSDLKMNLKLLTSFTFGNLKKWRTICEDCVPYRVKGFHIINYSFAPQPVIMLMRTMVRLMSAKMQSRVFFHDNLDSLHQILPKTILPIEYGGSAGLMCDLMMSDINLVNNSRDWFLTDQQYGIDESKWLSSPKSVTDASSSNDLMGVQGVFKSLDID